MNKQVEPVEPVEPDTWPKTLAEVSALFGGKTGTELYSDVAASLRYMGNPSWVTRCAAVVLECNPPAQTPPPGEDFCYCGEEISLQSVSGGAAPEGLYGAVTLRVKGEYVRYVKAQTPPPRLTVSEICEADPLPHAMFDDERVDFARAIESAVRKQWAKHFGVNDE